MAEGLVVRRARSDEYLAFHDLCDNDAPHPVRKRLRATASGEASHGPEPEGGT